MTNSTSKNRLLILNGSPIRGSTTDVLSERIADGAAQDGWSHETVFLNDLVIKPCQSCGVREDDDLCIYHDDLYPVYKKFSICDAVVAATPVYFDTVSAQLKLFIDRCNCYRPLRQSPSGEHFLEKRVWKERRGIIVLVGGPRQKYDCAMTVIKGFLIWTGVKFFDSLCYSHESWAAGAAKDDPDIMHKAFDLGRSLTV
ncbi:MAG: flavodoxin family protein [candidate division Zixibacteria bacterium]|nr:flavodoxin family protein [candidate division Zixibacteria bacterium]MBU1470023.1 flavodoxin family protein [candidate division Zixibacteria bacterium]MBU2623951.1 flavodoxin family protein [candidate division Zixibacteria bacterium]